MQSILGASLQFLFVSSVFMQVFSLPTCTLVNSSIFSSVCLAPFHRNGRILFVPSQHYSIIQILSHVCPAPLWSCMFSIINYVYPTHFHLSFKNFLILAWRLSGPAWCEFWCLSLPVYLIHFCLSLGCSRNVCNGGTKTKLQNI